MSQPPASDEASVPTPSTSPASANTRNIHPRLRLAMVGIVIVGAVGFLLVKGLGSSLDYFKTVDQALSDRAHLGTTTFRLEGTVVPGTILRNVDGASFDVSEGAKTIHVVNAGTPPQLFKDAMPVVAVGHFAPTSPTGSSTTTFLSDQILVKHTSSYIAAHPDRVRAPDGSSR